MQDLKPIETFYNDYHFRSRLEARWAVYFDALGIEYEYEKEGYDLGDSGYYLPDFWLNQVSMWAEVKGKDFTEDENKKAKALAILSGKPVLRLVGIPDYRTYLAWVSDKNGNVFECDYLVSTYHKYFYNEHRFYSNTEVMDADLDFTRDYVSQVFGNTMEAGITAAKSARFEHGEMPRFKTDSTGHGSSYY